MKRRWLSVILSASMVVGTLTAGTTMVHAEEGDPDRTFKILSMWPEDDNDSGSVIKQVTEQYIAEENPDFKYEIEVVSSDNLKQKVATLAASNDLPDVFAYDAGTPLIDLMDAGLVLDVGAKLDELGISDRIDPSAKDFLTGLTGTESLYDLPLGQNIEGFWYNKALFEQAGITEPPTTWDEMLEDADKLLEAGIQPFAVGASEQWPATRILNAYVIRKLGTDAMDKAYAGEIKYTDEAIVEAAAMLQDMTEKGYFGEGATTVDQNTAAEMVMAGEAAMIYNGSWYVSQLQADTNPAGEDGIGFFNIPTVEGGVGTATEYCMNCGTILALSADKYDSVTEGWLKYFVENAGPWAIENQGTLRGYTIDEYPEDLGSYSQLVLEEIEKATGSATWWEAAMDSKLSQIAQENVQSLMNGDMTPEEYAQSLQDVWDAAQ
ncbi:MAG TPA: extracellular solute-binding protein [Candidatus Blautia faecavium]|uniref:Extracellular solute-binding protein n=1 Tax=Candidatus Blautia faecavium TaxID=2838487 RepID=A0A9D2RVY1_9FIRM|nr:extracellular solute-binding protein [Candidatus Blautia faecavium]